MDVDSPPSRARTGLPQTVFSINQNKYNEAIKAYEILCLKYPKKISLFADQIKTIKNSFQNK